MPLRREESEGVLRREGDVRGGEFGGGALSLEAQIIALFAAAGWTVGGLFLHRSEADLTLVSGDASVSRNYGTGGDAIQGTALSRPTWNPTGLNGRGSLDCDGGDSMVTAAIDSGIAAAYTLSALFKDSDTAAKYVASYGEIAAGDGLAVIVNQNLDRVGAHCMGDVGASRADTAASFPMTTPAVVSATWDSALAVNEAEIRHAGTNQTSVRFANSNNTLGAGSQAITMGAREGPAANITGSISALCLAWGSTAIPTTELAAVEALIAAEWGV